MNAATALTKDAPVTAASVPAVPAVPAVGLETVVRRAPSTSWREQGNETVILDNRRRILRGVNATAGLAWRLADGSRSVADIAQEVAAATHAEESRVRADLLTFFAQLRGLDLVVAA